MEPKKRRERMYHLNTLNNFIITSHPKYCLIGDGDGEEVVVLSAVVVSPE